MVILKSGVGNYVNLDDRIYSYFAGNNYLGLANHPEVIKAAVEAIQKYGINFSASRQTTGTSELHLLLEKNLSEFNQKEDSVVFASGYLSNRIILHALRNRYSSIFYDELSHPSIVDGFPAGVNAVQYQHSDPLHLERLLREAKNEKALIITDGVFPITGEIASLDRICEVAVRYGAMVVVDDAHSAGILGNNGRGTAEYFDLEGWSGLYQTGTMSKALGSYGGFISAGKDTIESIRISSSCYMASTALPPALVAAAIASIKIMKQQPYLRNVIQSNSLFLKNQAKELGFLTFMDPTPIIPLIFDSEAEALNLSGYLKKNNIIAPYVKYPVKMNKFIVRITVSATHTEDQIQNLLEVLNQWIKKYGINPN